MNTNLSRSSDVSKNPSSKECCELFSSSLNSTSEKIRYPSFGLNNCKKESVLKSKENEMNESSVIPFTGSPRSRDGNALKTFATPTSARKTEMFTKSSSTPLKRSFSMIENDNDEETGPFTPKTSIKRIQENLNRKSLPAKAETELHTSSKDYSDKQIQNRRRSYPFAKSPYHSPTAKQNFRSFRTDQTPYSPGQNALHQQKRRRFNLPYYDAFSLMSLESESGFIDSHCHLDFIFQRQNYEGTYSEYQKEHEHTFPKSYRGCVAIFCNPFTFSKKDMWGKFLEEDNVWASFGCHPHNAKDYNDYIEKSLYAALKHSKVRALGEIGLDYSNRNNCMKTVQFEAFRRQLKIALEKQLPVVIHCREAHEDAMGIIKEILPIDYTIHLHCFTDTWEWAQKWLNEFPNLCIGITNVVTFPSAESVHEVAKNIPLNRLLLETDAPYFIPKRGCQGMRWSHPGLAIHVAAQIAALKNIPIEKVLQSTRSNTKRVYNI
ncbi:putative deoxyribonuclease TATDN2 like protein [Argiope bruennichi]|uniref:Putative deoxyribonuclease TATDN2 like protein n=1 Tax=Argiope bruennichi TaxID=94029 RepID=A0A8T0E6D0_ARGBR|nr:putative deoxyribonuclease TATDN2 like protein [Argiope bruennichi]